MILYLSRSLLIILQQGEKDPIAIQKRLLFKFDCIRASVSCVIFGYVVIEEFILKLFSRHRSLFINAQVNMVLLHQLVAAATVTTVENLTRTLK